jgi:hypothetical protein
VVPPKYVVLTQHSGSWCQFCPDGTVRFEDALAANGRSIGVSVHTGDAMTIPDGDALNTQYISGYPSGLVDIFKFPQDTEVELNRGIWDARLAERLTHLAPVSVSLVDVSYEPSTRLVRATVSAEFFGPASGDLRMNCWIVEDGVTGVGSGYDQVNFYDTQAGHPFYGAGNPIIGFEHDRTLRAMLGGTWGSTATIPPLVADGEVYTTAYAFILPPDFDETRISLVGMVAQYDGADEENRPILNSTEMNLFEIFSGDFEWGDSQRWTTTVP